MKGTAYEPGTLTDYQYTVIFTRYKGQWLLCKHKKRSTWETAGGKIDPGETPEECARRELYEETGAVDFDLEIVCDYWAAAEPHEVGKRPGAAEGGWANGVVFLAEVRKLGDLPESEMEKIGLFDKLPENLSEFTYPDIYREVLPRVLLKVLARQAPGGADVSLSQLMEMQRKLHARGGWSLAPDVGQKNLLWMVEEVGEVVSVVKKHGDIAVLGDEAVRRALVEEASDLLFYLTNALLCYGVTHEEWAEIIVRKNCRNMERDWPVH